MYAIVVGGAGALGGAFISHYNSLSFATINVDFKSNSEAKYNFSPTDSLDHIVDSLPADAPKNVQLIVNGAGGWCGGGADDAEFAAKCRKMWQMNVESSILAISLAVKLLAQNGFLVFVGAKAVATHPTPDMLAYAASKSAVASLAHNLMAQSERSGLSTSATILLLLPEVLDTEANRVAMPTANTASWTPVATIAEKVAEFMAAGEQLKAKGELTWIITTRSNETKFEATKSG